MSIKELRLCVVRLLKSLIPVATVWRRSAHLVLSLYALLDVNEDEQIESAGSPVACAFRETVARPFAFPRDL